MRSKLFQINRLLSIGLIALGASIFAEDARINSVIIEPAEVTFANADQSVQLLVTLQMSDGTLRDATRTARYVLPEQGAKVATIELGRVNATGDGSAIVTVSVDDKVQGKTINGSAKITVQNFAVARQVHFVNEIEPIFTKAGCNAGGCHGKSGGQNGFAMSLLGFDAVKDYDSIVREGRGRRIFPAAPAQSLVLTKAIGSVAHGGGHRFDTDSREYKLLLRWIEQGMPKGKDDDPKVDRVDVFPKERILIDSKQQQLRVVAHYTDGSTEDVTRRAEYKAQQPDILSVDKDGFVTSLGVTGEGALMIRYMGFVDVARICIPYSRGLPDSEYASFKPKNFVDELVMQKWKKLGIAPSPVCTDEEFIRRAYIDCIGTLPAADEVRAFLNDSAPNKRDYLIDRVLERDEYAAYWANLWGDLLRNKREGDEQKRGTFAFAEWIRNSFASNKPYDQFVREILTAQGEVGDNPPVNWYRHVRNQTHLVNDTAQLFLGTRVACANCHNHPYEKMSQDDYWGMAAFFQRVGKKQGDVPADQAVFVQKTGETSNPRTGKQVKPKGLNGPQFDYVRGEDPRIKLVDWMTAPDNPYFSKAFANRMWGRFMGIGIVDAVDDMRATNPPSNPALLDALAKDFVDHKYDIKALIKTIMKSQVYSLSSAPAPHNATDRQNYARYKPRRLAAEPLFDAVCTVTGMPEHYFGFPSGTRAIDLPDQAVSSYFLSTFGRSARETPCECERSCAPNLSQTLHLMNSPEIQGKIGDAKGFVAALLKDNKKKSDEMVEALYLRAYARMPHPDELKDAVTLLDSAKDKKAALEDVAWVLLNSKEFLFNH
ncbi:MAG TPA: DUF1549 domain-containing protein [Planctomycetota bacterium]|nr:DUF1549 domain-containing protein [Planctomycetota bacterium]